MYHPARIAASLEALAERPGFRAVLPSHDLLQGYPVADCRQLTRQLEPAYDPQKGQLTRPLTAEESAYITHEWLRCAVDYRYWAERHCYVNKAGRLESLYPLWESQELALTQIGAIEQRHYLEGHPDGILVAILKARQLGISTLLQSILAHRVTTHTYVRALIAADVPEQAEYLFSMLELVEERLPWFLRPTVRFFKRNRERIWANHSVVKSAAGKSMRGGLQEQGGEKGNLGRGSTYLLGHISEVSTWERPEQLDDAFLLGVPVAPAAFVGFESSAKGRHDYWHHFWLSVLDGSLRGNHEFTGIFIPWCIERQKYWLPPPPRWMPQPETLAEATRIETEVPRWIGRPITLTREQLYWYERTKAGYVRDDRQADFLEEFPSTPEDAFQHAGRSIFSYEVQQRIAEQARPLKCAFTVQPAMDLALLKQHEREQAQTPLAQTPAPKLPGQVPSPLAKAWSIDDLAPLPSGYGMKLIPTETFFATRSYTAPRTLLGALLVWEWPRRKGRYRYVIAADIADGFGQDAQLDEPARKANRTSIDVLRVGTVEEPIEQVAQYVSKQLSPTAAAYVIYALGRWYRDDRQAPAVLAIELNNHGLSTQDMLQLHLHYPISRFYRWEIPDHADPDRRWTPRIGWVTNQRTRPLIIDKLHTAVCAIDPLTKQPDLLINSPITREEMADFATSGALGEAEAVAGAYDDCLLSLAVGNYVTWRWQAGEFEPLEDRRRRRNLELARRATGDPVRADYRNSDASAGEMDRGIDPTSLVADDGVGDPDLW